MMGNHSPTRHKRANVFRSTTAAGVLAAAAMAGLTTQAGAQNLFWDSDADATTATGGAGTWDTGTSLWRLDAADGSLQAWDNTTPSTATANFAGTGGGVTIAAGTTVFANNLVFGVNSYTISGGDALAALSFSGANPTVQVSTSGHTATFSAPLGGAGFNKTGLGVLNLTADNSAYAGGITVSAGQLNIATATALGTGTLTINGGIVAKGQTADLTLTTNNPMVWNGNFTFAVGSNDNIFNVGSGTVTLGAHVTVNETSNGKGRIVVNGDIADGDNDYSLTVTGSISAAQQLILGGTNTYSGGTVLNSGGLGIASNSALGSGALTVNGGSLSTPNGQSRSLGNTIVLNSSLSFGNSNAINAAGTLTLTAATLSLSTSRAINVQQGTLIINSTIDDGAESFGVTYVGGRYAAGTLRLNGNNTFDGGLTVQTWGNRTLLLLGDAGALGTGTLRLTGGSAASGNNSIRISNVSGSAMILSGNNAQEWDTDFIFGMNDSGVALGSSLNLGTGAVSLGTTSTTATRTVNVNHQTLTVGGAISNGTTTTGLTKTGGATLALAGANQYSGPTFVTAGTLRLDDTGSLANGNVSVAGGTLSGTGTIHFNLGSTPDQMLLTSGTLNVSGLTLSLVGPLTQAQYVLIDYAAGGTLTTATNEMTGNTFFNVINLPGHMEIVNDTVAKQVVLVPEPAGLGLIGLAAAGLLSRRRRTI